MSSSVPPKFYVEGEVFRGKDTAGYEVCGEE